ncbi:hypothetical protein [Streptomyces sp. NPDC060027]|uniref:hypothetical protein n=1 Tax=Streptomyces sp. NPDC060027 TaxID=3347040 RepID=UPI0036833A2E
MQHHWSTAARRIVTLWIIALGALGAAGPLAGAPTTAAGPASSTVVGLDEEDWH